MNLHSDRDFHYIHYIQNIYILYVLFCISQVATKIIHITLENYEFTKYLKLEISYRGINFNKVSR